MKDALIWLTLFVVYWVGSFMGRRRNRSALREAERSLDATQAIIASYRRQGVQPIDDLRRIMEALDIPTHARPYSPHEVVERDVLPEIKRLRGRSVGRLAPRDLESSDG